MPTYLEPIQLPIWDAGERPQREQFNDAFKKLNSAYAGITTDAIKRAETAASNAKKSADSAADAVKEAQRIAADAGVEYKIDGDRVGFKRPSEKEYNYTDHLTGPVGQTGKKGEPGKPIKIARTFETLEELNTAFPDGDGDNSYLVDGKIYIYASGKWNETVIGAGGSGGGGGQSGLSIIQCDSIYDPTNKIHMLTPADESQTIPTSGIIPVTFIPDADFHAGDKLRFNGQDCDAVYSNTDLAVADGAFRAGFVTSVIFQFMETGGTDRSYLAILHNGEVAYASNAGKLNGLASEAYIQPQDDMLINSNWQYGYVNQKGQTRYNTDGHCLDNWRVYNTDVIINSGSINIKSKAQDGYKHFSQKTEHTLKAGNVYTITMLAKINSAENAFFRPSTKQLSGITGTSGLKLTAGSKFELYSCTFIPTEDVESGTLDFIAGNGASHNYDIDLAAVKLEPGPRFTGWPAWDYGTELARCQRYQIEIFDKKITGQSYLAQVKANSPTLAYGAIPIPVSMRDGVLPVIETDCSADNPYLAFGVCSSGYNSRIEITEISVYSKMNNGVVLRVKGSDFIQGNDYQIYVNNTSAHHFLLNCNL